MNALAKKLQIKTGSSWLLYNAPASYLALLEPNGEFSTSFATGGSFNGVQIFVKNSTELSESLKVIVSILNQKAETIFWVIYPKKSANIPTDLAMMSSWSELENYGFTSVAAAAIDSTWTALRFRPAALSKASNTRNEEIQKNGYAQYVDVVNKIITLPNDMADLLQQNPAAMDRYQSLSYANRKEYVLWIVTAKQEKTRADRLAKMTEKLVAGKKNPSDK